MDTREIQYFRQLDGFRFLSIMAVMFSHFGESFSLFNRLPLGFGVLFFFVLSSFLITRILLASKASNELIGVNNLFSLRQFYIRRFLRIFPVYYLLIIFMYVINWHPCREIIGYLLTYTTNIKIANGFNAANFNHLWSLAVEEQFYIFFPFLIFFVNTKYILNLLFVFTFIGLFARASLYLYNSQYIPFSNFNTISCLDSLGVGSILAYLSIYRQDYLKRIISNRYLFTSAVLLFLLSMIAGFSIYSAEARYNFISLVLMRFFFNVMAFWILGWAVTFSYSGILKSILENKAVVYLGRISYGMYLYHLFVPQLANILFHHFRINFLTEDTMLAASIRIILYIIVTIGIASASWFLIEKPINSIKKYFSYNKRLSLLA
jgi:peptidoglycan/LPS O-acetylase OafA/YrhL